MNNSSKSIKAMKPFLAKWTESPRNSTNTNSWLSTKSYCKILKYLYLSNPMMRKAGHAKGQIELTYKSLLENGNHQVKIVLKIFYSPSLNFFQGTQFIK
jgi:hypothetical protein